MSFTATELRLLQIADQVEGQQRSRRRRSVVASEAAAIEQVDWLIRDMLWALLPDKDKEMAHEWFRPESPTITRKDIAVIDLTTQTPSE